MKPVHEYGLLIERVNRYGTEYVDVRLARREPQYDHPVGCPSDGEMLFGYGCPRHLIGLALDGLGMFGFVSDSGDPAFIAHDVEFRDVHASSEAKLRRMMTAIKRVNTRIEKADAREPGDKFMALASALRLSFAVERIKRNGDADDWRWMPVTEGRNRYRALIEQAVGEAVERKSGR